MESTKQASFHRSASGVEHEKHGCVWHFHGVVRGDHMVSALWSTSELIVSDCEFLFTPGLHARTRHDVVVHGQWTGTAVGEVRARHLVLRFLFIPFWHPLYESATFITLGQKTNWFRECDGVTGVQVSKSFKVRLSPP